jgi:hypothetical protein
MTPECMFLDMGGGENILRTYCANLLHCYAPLSSCPGRNLAEATVWLAVVSILAVFNITPDLDEHGKEIPIAIEYTSGVMRYG